MAANPINLVFECTSARVGDCPPSSDPQLPPSHLSLNCGHPAVPLNTRVSLSQANLSPGTTATYTCDSGYELFGASQRTCSSDGTWTGELPFCGTNVAFRKPANQSTTVRGGNAGNANDGQKSTIHDGKQCTETLKEASPWWQVDLLRPYPIKVVRVTTRGCCGHQPLKDIEIRVGNSSFDLQKNPLCAWFPGTIEEGVTKTFTCARTLVGQYVFLQLVGVDGSLSLCEVEVFSTDEFSSDRCAPPGSSVDADLSSFGGTCYEFSVTKGGSFEVAREHCKKHGGDLIHNLKGPVNTFLLSELERRKPKLKTQLVWIGVQKEEGITSRTWKWVDGQVVSRPSWGKDQPNNYNGEQNCAVLDGGRNWLWNDVGCNLDYLHWVCQHKPSTCGSPDKLANTTTTGNSREVGAVIKYSCPEGHSLVGPESRTCTKEGSWSDSAPTCKYVDCGPLLGIEHGSVQLESGKTTYGAVAVYSCHENYTLIGKEKRKCGDGGAWTEQIPQCLLDWCPEPPKVHGGKVEVNGRRAGSVATYTCQSGFILFGTPVLSCGLGGDWSGKAPTCKFIDCGAPPNIDNGHYRLVNDSTTFGSVVEYSCSDDYWLEGQKRQICTREGKWSSDAPSCELITCDEPEVPSGSYVVGYDFNIHSNIEYHCETGHILKGEPNHQCMPNGDWSGTPPTCEFIDCGKVPPMLYGAVAYTNNTTFLGSEIRYTCVKNYRLSGPSVRYCMENKQWSDSSPKCEEIRCPEPVVAEHSILSVTGNDRVYGRTLIRTSDSEKSFTTYKIGALVKYRCERGYKIIGESLSTCEDTGNWSGGIPQCVYVECGTPESIKNGRYTLATNATYYGAALHYECDENFQLDGHARRLCLENGTWSSETPTCKEIECDEPERQVGMVVHVTSRRVGGVAHYSCSPGQNMEGNKTRVCLQKGIWSGHIPLCISVDCKHPGSIENGRVIVMNGTTTYNSAVEYHCVPQYERVGPYLRKCMEDGTWSGEEPRCELVPEEGQASQTLPLAIGISAGVVIFLLIILGLVYLRLRKATPVKNTENIEGAVRKEEQGTAAMSYATLSDRNGVYGGPLPNMYENVHDDRMYDAPYEESRRRPQRSVSSNSSHYEPSPVGRRNRNMVTINGVAVR
ncbi:hypothetical protein RUM44_010026 [Polyplax serrata]|uniref:Uncharacterized protein n=1 Tax=Polyplax serrata TaxID=468196 RepID=A0ABR1AVX3_POLSC